MKERLDQLTLSQFVNLVCGDISVLLTPGEHEDHDKLTIATRNIVLEYRAIADPGGTNSYLQHTESWIKSKMCVIIFTMCTNLIALKQFERTREVLEAYGMPASGWNKSRISGTVQAKLAQAERELQELESEGEAAAAKREDIRAQFDSQTASVMVLFKFQIDPDTIKASLYANLVARFNKEVKAQIAAMKKK